MTRPIGMRRVTVTALCALLLLSVAGCTGRSRERPVPPVYSGSPPVLTAPSAASSTPPQVVPTTPGATGKPAPSRTPPRREDCVASTEEATVRPNEEAGPICLTAGAKLIVTAAPSPTRPWQLLATSDAAVLSCQSNAGPNGSIAGTCAALKPGTVIVSTQTKAFNDGAIDRWRLTITIVS